MNFSLSERQILICLNKYVSRTPFLKSFVEKNKDYYHCSCKHDSDSSLLFFARLNLIRKVVEVTLYQNDWGSLVARTTG